MADGLNDARALRVTELMRDYQEIQRKIAGYGVQAPAQQQSEAGYMVARQAQAEARSLLNLPYPVELLHPPTGAGEAQKRQLQRVIIDASSRRFRAQKCLLKTIAAVKWINRRKQIIPTGQQPQPQHRAALQQAENAMRAEINAATPQRIWTMLRSADQQKNHWLLDDPSVQALQSWIAANHSGSSSS